MEGRELLACKGRESGGIPQDFLKNGCSEIESEGISESNY